MIYHKKNQDLKNIYLSYSELESPKSLHQSKSSSLDQTLGVVGTLSLIQIFFSLDCCSWFARVRKQVYGAHSLSLLKPRNSANTRKEKALASLNNLLILVPTRYLARILPHVHLLVQLSLNL